MDPDSNFIKRTLATKMVPSIRYYLFFGHKGSGGLFRQNNDNTVTLESMLDSRAQADALKTTGLNEDHVSILSSAEMMGYFKTILVSAETNKDKTYQRSKGYLNVKHTFDPLNTKIPTQMTLVLIPTAPNEKDRQLKINPLLPEQETGDIVPGKYKVYLSALGFKAEPNHIPLDITAGHIADVKFVLKPQGMVANYIYAATATHDNFWGSYKELPKNVKINSIRITGVGISRTLTPDDTLSDREEMDTFLASRDYAYKNGFVFFDLPAGDYDLTVDAKGCETFTTRIKVQPGDFTPFAPFRLIVK